MKIAIRGHKTRGQEVIEILKSLGGRKEVTSLQGNSEFSIYFIREDLNNLIVCDFPDSRPNYKKYTLEEFEKEFPFKVGDTVINNEGNEGFIIGLITMNSKILYSVKYNYNQFGIVSSNLLKLKKKDMNARNITLTLTKAKEWYKKNEELREIALQAYSEEELTKVELPKSWEEFCDNYPVKGSEAMINCNAEIIDCINIQGKREYVFKDIMPSQKSAKAHLAMIQLEQLRDCYRQGWRPNWKDFTEVKYCITIENTTFRIRSHGGLNEFLSFQSIKIAEEFLKNFEPLIKEADDLI